MKIYFGLGWTSSVLEIVSVRKNKKIRVSSFFSRIFLFLSLFFLKWCLLSMILTIRRFTLLKLPRKNHKTQKKLGWVKKKPGFSQPWGREGGGRVRVKILKIGLSPWAWCTLTLISGIWIPPLATRLLLCRYATLSLGRNILIHV